MIRSVTRCSFFAFLMSFPLVVFGGELPKNFTLGKYVPADSWLMVHMAHNAERDFIDKHWAEVFEKLSQSGIEQDIANLIQTVAPEGEREEIKKHWDTVTDALRAVSWGELSSKEIVFSQKMGMPMPNYLIMFRSDAEHVGEHVASLKNLMSSLASLSERVTVEETKIGETQVWRMAVVGPVVIELFKHKELVGLSTGEGGVAKLQPLLTGEQKKSFIDTPEFERAMAGVESPEDAVMYFGIHRLIDQMKGMMKSLPMENKPTEEQKKEIDQKMGIVTRGMDRLDVIDHVMVTMKTDGLREHTHEVVTLLPDATTKRFGKALLPRHTFDRFDRYVPEEATGFMCTTMIDFNLIYDEVIDFLKVEFPDQSKEWLAKFDSLQEDFNFNIKKDLLSWIDGDIMWVSMPGVGMQAGGALMVRLSDAELAKEKIDHFIKRAQERQETTQLIIKPIEEVEAEGFYSVMHPVMMMAQAKPVLGIHGEWLVIGSGPQDVNKILAAGKDGAATIRNSERFKNEGVRISGKVTGASFSDLQNMGQETAMMLSMMGMMGAMSVQGGEEVAPVRAIFSMLAKLGPVAAEMDFFNSSSSVTKFDGRRWTTNRVTNYKPYEAEQTD